MIERALEYAAKKTSGAEIRVSGERSSDASYEDDKLKKVWATQETRVSVRLIVNGKLGQAYGTNPAEIEPIVDRTIELAEFGSEAPFEFPGPAETPEVEIYDPQVAKTTREELVAESGEIVDRVKTYNPEIKMSADCGWQVADWRMMNTSAAGRQPARQQLCIGRVGGAGARDRYACSRGGIGSGGGGMRTRKQSRRD